MNFIKYILFLIPTVIYSQNDQWSVYMTPSEVHKQLSDYIGKFDIEVKMWMETSKEPMIVTAKSTNKMTLGERFLEMSQSGDMMGMDYQASSILGYNTISKEFTFTNITNMGTGTLTLIGKWVEEGKSIDLKGQMVNPENNALIDVRQVISFLDKDHFLVENFVKFSDGPEQKSIEYRYTRSK